MGLSEGNRGVKLGRQRKHSRKLMFGSGVNGFYFLIASLVKKCGEDDRTHRALRPFVAFAVKTLQFFGNFSHDVKKLESAGDNPTDV